MMFKATLAFMDMMARFTDHSPSWVKIPARMAGMPHTVWSSPVTSPAAMPDTVAASSATHRLIPWEKSTTNTAPPVQKEPSTVKSAMSRIL